MAKKISYIILAITFAIIVFFYLKPIEPKNDFDANEDRRFETVIYGRYEQDNDKNNGKEDIEWYVLDEKDGYCLLMTKKTIISICYHDKDENITWKNSVLRLFLNEVFFLQNFNVREKMNCKQNFTTNNTVNQFGHSIGESTIDFVFILSIDELKKYFNSDYERQASGTTEAESLGMTLENLNIFDPKALNDATYYWTRDIGYSMTDAACVNADGHINVYGYNSTIDGLGARPCMWVKKEALTWEN